MVLQGYIPDTPTAPTDPSPKDAEGMALAIQQARTGLAEGGIPIGAALIHEDGTVLALGRNKRVQENSPIKHGETDCLNNAGRLPASVYAKCTMYTTLSPCPMCCGACVLFGIPRLVLGENTTFLGAETFLKDRAVEVINLDLEEPKQMMQVFIDKHPDIWHEDVGET